MADTNYNSYSGLTRNDPSLSPTSGQGALANNPVVTPTIDPRYGTLQGQQVQQANQYAQGGGQDSANAAYGGLRDTTNTQLAQAINANKTGYNQRGLLYSGLKQGGEADATTAAASQLASGQQGLNQQVLQNQTTLNQAPIATGIGMAGMGSNSYIAGANQSALNQQQALYNMQQNSNALSGLGLGVGQIGGVAAGYAFSPSGGAATSGYGAGYNPSYPSMSEMPNLTTPAMSAYPASQGLGAATGY